MPSQTFPDRVPRRLDLLWRRGGLLLAGGATACMLISCGGSSQPAITREATTTPAQPMAPARERSIDNKRRGPNAPQLADEAATDVRFSRGQPKWLSFGAQPRPMRRGRKGLRAGSVGRVANRQARRMPLCHEPSPMRRGRKGLRAGSVGRVANRQARRMPSAMSRAQCVAAGKAFERARSGSG